MDIAVLLLSMCLFFAIGMPIAFALALAALVGALVDRPSGCRRDAAAFQRRRQGIDADDSVFRAGREPSWPKAAWRGGWWILPPSSSASPVFAAACRRSIFSRPRS